MQPVYWIIVWSMVSGLIWESGCQPEVRIWPSVVSSLQQCSRQVISRIHHIVLRLPLCISSEQKCGISVRDLHNDGSIICIRIPSCGGQKLNRRCTHIENLADVGNRTALPQISIVHRPFYPGGQWFAETTQSIRKHLKNPEFRTCGETGSARKRKISSAAPCTAQEPTREPGSLRDISSNEKAIAWKTAAQDIFAF